MKIEEKIYLNALNLAFSPNIEKVWRILKKIPSPKKAFLSLKLKIDPEKEWKRLKKEKIKFITKDEKEYPPLLREIPNPPLGIYIKGEIKKDECSDNRQENKILQKAVRIKKEEIFV